MPGVKSAEPNCNIAPAGEQNPKLQLHVIYTGPESTRPALNTACELARDLDARVVLIVAKVVPYPLPLDSPLISKAFTENALTHLVEGLNGEVSVRVYLCRERDDAVRGALLPASVVVIGRKRAWWPDATKALARLLSRDGHQVIFAGRQLKLIALWN